VSHNRSSIKGGVGYEQTFEMRLKSTDRSRQYYLDGGFRPTDLSAAMAMGGGGR
jgi:hypothetical protein